SEAFPVGAVQIAGVIPPLRAEIGMLEMIAREDVVVTGQRRPICEIGSRRCKNSDESETSQHSTHRDILTCHEQMPDSGPDDGSGAGGGREDGDPRLDPSGPHEGGFPTIPRGPYRRST